MNYFPVRDLLDITYLFLHVSKMIYFRMFATAREVYFFSSHLLRDTNMLILGVIYYRALIPVVGFINRGRTFHFTQISIRRTILRLIQIIRGSKFLMVSVMNLYNERKFPPMCPRQNPGVRDWKLRICLFSGLEHRSSNLSEAWMNNNSIIVLPLIHESTFIKFEFMNINSSSDH